MNRLRQVQNIQRGFSVAAGLFGLVTIIAASRVILGSDPEYVVFRPLLLYNAAMGVTYLAAGAIAWRNLRHGVYAAAAIFALNFLILGIVGYLYSQAAPVALESVRAMIFRTIVWLIIFLGLAWVSRQKALARERHA